MSASKILIAVDLSALAEDVIRYGCKLATALGSKVTIMHSVPNIATWKGYEPSLPLNIEDEMEKTARNKLNGYVETVEKAWPGTTSCVESIEIFAGNPTELVTSHAKDGRYGLIIVGYRGHSAIERLLVGSTAANIARYAANSVLIYRPGADNL